MTADTKRLILRRKHSLMGLPFEVREKILKEVIDEECEPVIEAFFCRTFASHPKPIQLPNIVRVASQLRSEALRVILTTKTFSTGVASLPGSGSKSFQTWLERVDVGISGPKSAANVIKSLRLGGLDSRFSDVNEHIELARNCTNLRDLTLFWRPQDVSNKTGVQLRQTFCLDGILDLRKLKVITLERCPEEEHSALMELQAFLETSFSQRGQVVRVKYQSW